VSIDRQRERERDNQIFEIVKQCIPETPKRSKHYRSRTSLSEQPADCWSTTGRPQYLDCLCDTVRPVCPEYERFQWSPRLAGMHVLTLSDRRNFELSDHIAVCSKLEQGIIIINPG